MSVRIVIDSASDMTQAEAQAAGLDFLPLKTLFGEEEYLDGISITHREFYEKLIESDIHPTTSQIAPYDYEDKFREIRDAGDTAVCICLSSKLSGSYQSANIALAGYEDCICLVDTLSVAIGERLLVDKAVELRDMGATAKEIADVLTELRDKVCVIALLDTLEYLRKGGRISGAAAMAGNLLSIKPVITIEKGVVETLGKARGSKNGQNLLREYTKRMNVDYTKPACLAYTGLTDELLMKYIGDSEEIYAPFGYALPICTIGSTIGTHVGPGAIAVAFFSK